MIWAYQVPNDKGGIQIAYGTPVQVFLPGKGYVQAVYQFGTPELPCAVVDLKSGRIIAKVGDHHLGAPQQRAQAACQEALSGIPAASIVNALDTAPIINTAPAVVGVMK